MSRNDPSCRKMIHMSNETQKCCAHTARTAHVYVQRLGCIQSELSGVDLSSQVSEDPLEQLFLPCAREKFHV